ncbi:MAG TPA: hypothetical protein VG754_14275 [Verrucomicrobiae bacterium]|nr:hypothetical protein [Verrucomicrobiae bacterium]
MKRTTRTLIATVAITGLLSGTAINQARARDDAGNKDSATAPGKEAKKMPKVQDCAGKNDCKGIGGCKTDSHGCKFKNDCKGKGGCSITKADIKKWEKMQKEKKS